MSKRTFIIRYFFTSSSANGNDYTREIQVVAKDKPNDRIARVEGFREFGVRFNDNCYDWKILA